jgi:hypothetical protein
MASPARRLFGWLTSANPVLTAAGLTAAGLTAAGLTAAGLTAAGLTAAGLTPALLERPAHGQQQGYGQTIQDSNNGGASTLGPGVGKSGSILDAANPIDLMNRLRRSQALDDATPPSSAIDQALKDYSAQSGGSGVSPSAGVKGP